MNVFVCLTKILLKKKKKEKEEEGRGTIRESEREKERKEKERSAADYRPARSASRLAIMPSTSFKRSSNDNSGAGCVATAGCVLWTTVGFVAAGIAGLDA